MAFTRVWQLCCITIFPLYGFVRCTICRITVLGSIELEKADTTVGRFTLNVKDVNKYRLGGRLFICLTSFVLTFQPLGAWSRGHNAP
jgi:hypothetical protein